MKRLFIRADSNGSIGIGHIMRCLALAQEWQYTGGEVTFISHCESVALRQRIIEEGFDFANIKNPHPDPSDLQETISLVSTRLNLAHGGNSCARTWLVIDGYHFSSDYQEGIRDAGIRLLVIDDMNHLPSYHADVLVNQNLHAQDLDYKCDEDTVLLLGNHYVLLRKEFLKHKNRTLRRSISGYAKNIMVTFGGGDSNNLTLKTIQAVKLIGDCDIKVKVIVGPANQNIWDIKKQPVALPPTCDMLFDVDNMPELMTWADMAISGGGSTCWELAYMGVPNIVIVLAENQRRISEALHDAGISINLGWHSDVTNTDIMQSACKMIQNPNLRKEMSGTGEITVDGEGSRRVVELMRERSNDDLSVRA